LALQYQESQESLRAIKSELESNNQKLLELRLQNKNLKEEYKDYQDCIGKQNEILQGLNNDLKVENEKLGKKNDALQLEHEALKSKP
jgi:predicted  nucleic acid-binding Zn-ribbon protein